jgi:hypothetical protein
LISDSPDRVGLATLPPPSLAEYIRRDRSRNTNAVFARERTSPFVTSLTSLAVRLLVDHSRAGQATVFTLSRPSVCLVAH